MLLVLVSHMPRPINSFLAGKFPRRPFHRCYFVDVLFVPNPVSEVLIPVKKKSSSSNRSRRPVIPLPMPSREFGFLSKCTFRGVLTQLDPTQGRVSLRFHVISVSKLSTDQVRVRGLVVHELVGVAEFVGLYAPETGAMEINAHNRVAGSLPLCTYAGRVALARAGPRRAAQTNVASAALEGATRFSGLCTGTEMMIAAHPHPLELFTVGEVPTTLICDGCGTSGISQRPPTFRCRHADHAAQQSWDLCADCMAKFMAADEAHGLSTPSHGITLLRGFYGTADCRRGMDVTSIVGGFFTNAESKAAPPVIIAQNASFGDPLPGVGKVLTLHCIIDGQAHKLITNENHRVIFPPSKQTSSDQINRNRSRLIPPGAATAMMFWQALPSSSSSSSSSRADTEHEDVEEGEEDGPSPVDAVDSEGVPLDLALVFSGSFATPRGDYAGQFSATRDDAWEERAHAALQKLKTMVAQAEPTGTAASLSSGSFGSSTSGFAGATHSSARVVNAASTTVPVSAPFQSQFFPAIGKEHRGFGQAVVARPGHGTPSVAPAMTVMELLHRANSAARDRAENPTGTSARASVVARRLPAKSRDLPPASTADISLLRHFVSGDHPKLLVKSFNQLQWTGSATTDVWAMISRHPLSLEVPPLIYFEVTLETSPDDSSAMLIGFSQDSQQSRSLVLGQDNKSIAFATNTNEVVHNGVRTPTGFNAVIGSVIGVGCTRDGRCFFTCNQIVSDIVHTLEWAAQDDSSAFPAAIDVGVYHGTLKQNASEHPLHIHINSVTSSPDGRSVVGTIQVDGVGSVAFQGVVEACREFHFTSTEVIESGLGHPVEFIGRMVSDTTIAGNWHPIGQTSTLRTGRFTATKEAKQRHSPTKAISHTGAAKAYVLGQSHFTRDHPHPVYVVALTCLKSGGMFATSWMCNICGIGGSCDNGSQENAVLHCLECNWHCHQKCFRPTQKHKSSEQTETSGEISTAFHVHASIGFCGLRAAEIAVPPGASCFSRTTSKRTSAGISSGAAAAVPSAAPLTVTVNFGVSDFKSRQALVATIAAAKRSRSKISSAVSSMDAPEQPGFVQTSMLAGKLIQIQGSNGTFVLSTARGVSARESATAVANKSLSSVECALLSQSSVSASLRYFELTVLRVGSRCLQSIGFVANTLMEEAVAGIIGRTGGSLAWNSNGIVTQLLGPLQKRLLESDAQPSEQPFGTFWATGDVIGAGLHLDSRTAFFTRNGRILHTVDALRDLPTGIEWRPAVSFVGGGQEVLVNLSGEADSPFLWNGDCTPTSIVSSHSRIPFTANLSQITVSLIASFLTCAAMSSAQLVSKEWAAAVSHPIAWRQRAIRRKLPKPGVFSIMEESSVTHKYESEVGELVVESGVDSPDEPAHLRAMLLKVKHCKDLTVSLTNWIQLSRSEELCSVLQQLKLHSLHLTHAFGTPETAAAVIMLHHRQRDILSLLLGLAQANPTRAAILLQQFAHLSVLTAQLQDSGQRRQWQQISVPMLQRYKEIGQVLSTQSSTLTALTITDAVLLHQPKVEVATAETNNFDGFWMMLAEANLASLRKFDWEGVVYCDMQAAQPAAVVAAAVPFGAAAALTEKVASYGLRKVAR